MVNYNSRIQANDRMTHLVLNGNWETAESTADFIVVATILPNAVTERS